MRDAETENPCHPAVESIARAIEMQKVDGLSAIAILNQMTLQIVGTNHKAIYMCDATGEQVPATRFGLDYLAKLLYV